MGLAASQARLISLTARMSDLEYEGQQINQQRQVLTNKMTEVYNQAMAMEVPTPPSKVDFAHEAYTGNGGKVVFEKDDFGNFTGYEIKEGTAVNPYQGDVNTNTQIEDILKTFSVKTTKASNNNNISAHLTDLDALRLGLVEYDNSTEKYKVKSNGQGIINPNVDDGGWDCEDISKLPNNVSTIAGLPKVSLKVATDYVNQCNGDVKTRFDEGYQAFQDYIGDSFDETKVEVLLDNNGNASFTYNGAIPTSAGSKVSGKEFMFKLETDANAHVTISGITPIYDGNGNIQKIQYVNAAQEGRTVDVEQNGNYYNEKQYEAAMRQYNRDKIEYDQIQNEYNKQTSIYQRQDKQLELKLTRLDNERNALNTEIESVKKVIQDASEKGFKTFSG